MTQLLAPHPDFPPRSVTQVAVDWSVEGPTLRLAYRVDGAVPRLPEPVAPGRADNLWQATCFELFLRTPGSAAYAEFNFSSSGQWAAYAFDDYRAGMRDLPLGADPIVTIDADGMTLRVELNLAGIWGGPTMAALTAILIEQDGTKSYWSLAHPRGKPDFHDPACFILELPAPPLA